MEKGYQIFVIKCLPGQYMHGFSSVVATLGSHCLPPLRRLGLLQVLCLLCLPGSHNWSHLPHSLHSVNPPSTKTAHLQLSFFYINCNLFWKISTVLWFEITRVFSNFRWGLDSPSKTILNEVCSLVRSYQYENRKPRKVEFEIFLNRRSAKHFLVYNLYLLTFILIEYH